jgi:hypothetical protein
MSATNPLYLIDDLFCKPFIALNVVKQEVFDANVATYNNNPAFKEFIDRLAVMRSFDPKAPHADFLTLALQGPGIVIGMAPDVVELAKSVGFLEVKTAKPRHWSSQLLSVLMPIGYKAMSEYFASHRSELEAKLPELCKMHNLSLADVIVSTGKPNPGASCEVEVKGFVIEKIKDNRKGTGRNVTRTASKPGVEGAVERTATLFLCFRNDLIRPVPLTGKKLEAYEAALKAGDADAAAAAVSADDDDEEESSENVE